MKKILFILFLILTVFLSSCTKQEEKIVKKYYDSQVVQTGAIDLGESYVGYAHGVTEVTLSTMSNGKITFLKSKKGDQIKTGDLLATLDSLDGKVAYSTADNVIGSIETIKDFTSMSYDEQIKILEKKIEEINTASNTVDTTTNNLSNIRETEILSGKLMIKQAGTALDTAKNELEQSINVYEGSKQDLFKSGKNVITNSMILDTNIINFSDELLGVTEANKDKNNAFQDFLGAKNIDVLNQTKESFNQTNILFLEYKDFYETYIENKNPSQEEIMDGLEKGLKLAEQIKQMLNLLYKTVDNSVENTSLTTAMLQGYRVKISDFGAQVEQSVLTVNGDFVFGLRGTKESLDSLDRNFTKQKVLLEQKVALAQDNLETAKQSLDKITANSIFSTDNELSKKEIYAKQIEGIKAQIESIKSEKSAKLKELDGNIIKAKGEKDQASIMIQYGKIISPIDGVVLEKMAEVGQVTSPGNPIYMVGDDSKIKVNIDVLVNNLADFSIGTKLEVEFDGLTQRYTGTVSNIASSSDTQTKKTNVEITIDNTDKKVKIGTIAKVYHKQTFIKTDGIIIPISSIIQKYSIPGVYVLSEGKAVFTKIQILKQNSDFAQVNGLKLGDKIITNGKENIYDGEILE